MELNTKQDIEDCLDELYDENLYNKERAFKCVLASQKYKDLDLEYRAKYAYFKQLIFLEFYDEAIAMFPWFLHMCDKHKERFGYFGILWS